MAARRFLLRVLVVAATMVPSTMAAVKPAGSASTGWQEVAALPRGLAGHAAAAVGNALWIAGGSYWDGDTKRIDSAVRRMPLAGGPWETVAAIPGGFAHGGAAADATALWLVGGLEARGPSAAIHRVDFATGRVSRVGTLPEPRVYCGAALLDGALWVIGGVASDSDLSRPGTTGWRVELTSAAPTQRIRRIDSPALVNPLVLALGGELHVLPGSIWSAARRRLEPPAHRWIYSPARKHWEMRTLAAPLPRGLAGAALDDRRALLTGGVGTRDGAPLFSAATWIYDATDGTFAAGPQLPAPRLAAAVVGNAAQVFVLGGEDRARSRSTTVWRLPVGQWLEGGKK